MTEPMSVSVSKAGARDRSISPPRMNGSDPPTLMKSSVTMFVASAVRAGMPNRIMTGTVISAVAPVTTVTMQVTKTIAARPIR